MVEFEWDRDKAASNLRKHGVRFAEAVTIFEDDAMLTMPDEPLDEERFVAIGVWVRLEEASLLFTRLVGIASESFPPAKQPAKSGRNTRVDSDEAAIRFQESPQRSGRAPNSRKDSNHDSARQ